MVGLKCKIYQDGIGWLYPWELDRKYPTQEQIIERHKFNLQFNRKKLGQIKETEDRSRAWETPTRDQAYIRDLELKNKYR